MKWVTENHIKLSTLSFYIYRKMASTESTHLRFQDKVVIVTGGCKGIGRGCVDVLSEYKFSLTTLFTVVM